MLMLTVVAGVNYDEPVFSKYPHERGFLPTPVNVRVKYSQVWGIIN